MSITFFAGNARKFAVEVINDTTNEPEDLTDATVIWQCSRGTAEKFNPTPVMTKTIGHGIEVTDAFNGLVEVYLTSADTADLAGTFYHELLLIDVSGDQQNIIADTFTIKRRLVKPA